MGGPDRSRVEEAVAFAAAAHAGQTDKAGHPYIFHPVAVAAAVADHGPLAMCVALLHDVVEDTPVTIDEIEERFGSEVAGPVGLLTKTEGADYDDYLAGLEADPVARTVKIADMRHNLGRIDRLGPAEQERLREKYEPRIARLEQIVD